jgi:hypothetical protein
MSMVHPRQDEVWPFPVDMGAEAGQSGQQVCGPLHAAMMKGDAARTDAISGGSRRHQRHDRWLYRATLHAFMIHQPCEHGFRASDVQSGYDVE